MSGRVLKRAISNKYFWRWRIRHRSDAGSTDRADDHGFCEANRTGRIYLIRSGSNEEHLKGDGGRGQEAGEQGDAPIVVTSPIVRMYFKKLTSDYLKDLIVISYNEIDSEVELKSVGVITIHDN